MSMKSKRLINIAVVASTTFVSRILGLMRDVMNFSLFGTSVLNSAFIFAFTLPNMFRRLLGEGALTSAMIPLMSEALNSEGKNGVFLLLNKVLTRALMLLTGLVILGILGMQGVQLFSGLEERWYLGAHLAIILMPYMLLVCVAAIFAAALNTLERFAIASLSAVWLNLSMIVSTGVLAYFFGDTPIQQVHYLCGGVLIGGGLQALIPAVALIREGWRWQWDINTSHGLREIQRLFLPGLFGAAIYQVNTVVSRILAFSLNSGAVSILYLAGRLVELPLGVFAIAITTVLFPNISLMATRKETEKLKEAYLQAIRMILAITIPATIGLILLNESILNVLFQWGKFSKTDVLLTKPILTIFALGIPPCALSTFMIRGFHSLKDTRTPVYVSAISFITNFLISIILMHSCGTIGLAFANLASMFVQMALLHKFLGKKEPAYLAIKFTKSLCQIAISAIIMGLFLTTSSKIIKISFGSTKWIALWEITLLIPLASIIYWLALHQVKFLKGKKVEVLGKTHFGPPK